jgi:hypothetical protein
MIELMAKVAMVSLVVLSVGLSLLMPLIILRAIKGE